MGEPAVRCTDLTKTFGPIYAVERVSFTVDQGSLIGLLGPSGVGKTTTLRIIAGFEVPDAGSVEIDGRVVTGPGSMVPPEKRRVGMVFQDYALFPHLSVRQNIAYGIPKGSESSRRVQEVMELVGLAELESRQPHELSGGEQQRVALARALAPNPAVVLLDEPFSNLDATLRAKVRSEVKRILQEIGTSAIFVTHDQEEALSLADRVGVMLHGRVVQVDTPEGLYARPASLAVAMFLGEANILDGQAASGFVECELGTLPTLQKRDGRVKVMVRPETVILRPPDPGALEAQVVEREFYGHDQVVVVRLPSGQLLRSRSGSDVVMQRGDLLEPHVESPVAVFAATE